jgi:RNA polymerase sigma-70 factor (ECF subfamily)
MPTAAPLSLQTIHTLYSDHHGWLYNWLRRRMGSNCDAADLAQDTFVRILVKPRDFDTFDGARAYLSTVARGLCVDLWRRREVEQAWLATLAAHADGAGPSAEDHAVIIEALCEVDAMLHRLPDKVARAFVMAQVHGMTYREIAAALEVSDRMVKKYMARAMLQCALLEAGRSFGPAAAEAG